MPNKSLSRSGLLTYQKYSSLLAGNDPYSPVLPAYDLLETEILTGSQSSITFSNLASTYGTDYQNLQIRAVARTDRAQINDALAITFNGDGGNNYAIHHIYSTGGSVGGGQASPYAYIIGAYVAAGSSAAGAFGSLNLNINDPFSSSKNTTIEGLAGNESPEPVGYFSGLWNNTAAIDSINLRPGIGSNLVSGTRISLYGLRG